MFDVARTVVTLETDRAVLAFAGETVSGVDTEPVAVEPADPVGCGGCGIKNIHAPNITMDDTIKMIMRFC